MDSDQINIFFVWEQLDSCIPSMLKKNAFVFQFFFNVSIFGGPKIKSIRIRRGSDISQIYLYVLYSRTRPVVSGP